MEFYPAGYVLSLRQQKSATISVHCSDVGVRSDAIGQTNNWRIDALNGRVSSQDHYRQLLLNWRLLFRIWFLSTNTNKFFLLTCKTIKYYKP
jgi:hypothetical protein